MMSLRSFSVLIALSITIGLSACGVQRSNFVNDQGLEKARQKDWNGARKDYSEAIRLNPNNANAYNNRGIAYDLLKQYQKAIADYTQVIRLNPNLADAYFNRGTAYNKLKEYQKALADYTQVIRLKPKYADAYLNRGNTYYWLKQYQKVIPDYEKAIRLNPNFRPVIGERFPTLLPLPKNGYGVYNFNRGATNSTLKIMPSKGTENLVIKLENTSTKKESCWFLIVKGNSHKMPIPPGSYMINLAIGKR
jgi:tetratricopeptide (TPR) repeat protein